MTRLTEEKLGLKMETTLLGGDASNYDTKLRLALTGYEKLPDIYQHLAAVFLHGGHALYTKDLAKKNVQ